MYFVQPVCLIKPLYILCKRFDKCLTRMNEMNETSLVISRWKLFCMYTMYVVDIFTSISIVINWINKCVKFILIYTHIITFYQDCIFEYDIDHHSKISLHHICTTLNWKLKMFVFRRKGRRQTNDILCVGILQMLWQKKKSVQFRTSIMELQLSCRWCCGWNNNNTFSSWCIFHEI